MPFGGSGRRAVLCQGFYSSVDVQIRHASLTSSIRRGIQQSKPQPRPWLKHRAAGSQEERGTDRRPFDRADRASPFDRSGPRESNHGASRTKEGRQGMPTIRRYPSGSITNAAPADPSEDHEYRWRINRGDVGSQQTERGSSLGSDHYVPATTRSDRGGDSHRTVRPQRETGEGENEEMNVVQGGETSAPPTAPITNEEVKRLRLGITVLRKHERGKRPSLDEKELVDKLQVYVDKLNAAAEQGRRSHGDSIHHHIFRTFLNGSAFKKYVRVGVPRSGSTTKTFLVVPDQGKTCNEFLIYRPVPNSARKSQSAGGGSPEDAHSQSAVEETRETKRGEVGPAKPTETAVDLDAGDEYEPESVRNYGLPSAISDNDDGPVPITHTTAASVFLYGYHSVVAALKGRRRKAYKLYMHKRALTRDGLQTTPIHALAQAAGVEIVTDDRAGLRTLDAMSGGRPHNGLVLECSRLPAPQVLGLGEVEDGTDAIPLKSDVSKASDIEIDGKLHTIPTAAHAERQPFVVLLDGITNPGNVGSIMRSAHFFGVDAIAVATNTCCPLSSPLLAKASSGACESVQLLSLPKPSSFVRDCAAHGWTVYAAVAPGDSPTRGQIPTETLADVARRRPLRDGPCLLMLGAEDEGLRDIMKNRAHRFVSIAKGARAKDSPDIGVDSMNVGVAAGVMMESFVRV